jgi:hypothetical protein
MIHRAGTILGIDPGDVESAYTLIRQDNQRPLDIGKVANDTLLDRIAVMGHDLLAVEMVASYGMPVGKEVFESVLWIGRFVQCNLHTVHAPWRLVYRSTVRWHHCHDRKARDPNVAQALRDRFAPGERNRGKGTKAQPGWFYGFADDIWQAYAAAVYVADAIDAEEEEARWSRQVSG